MYQYEINKWKINNNNSNNNNNINKIIQQNNINKITPIDIIW